MHWPGIDANIVDYVCQCTICTKHKASPPAQTMLPRDIPDGLWQEITANHLTQKDIEYLLVCDLLSNYPFLYKVSTKSAQSLSMHLQEVTSQYRLPYMLYNDNGLLFASNELVQFLQCHHIDHITSSPHFPRSNGFNECQVRTIKTALSTTQESRKSLVDLLLDLQSPPIRPYLPSPKEILHNKTFQYPGKPTTPNDMEQVCNYLLSKKQTQKTHFNRAHGTRELPELGLGQEVLFWSPTDNEYIPGTMVNKPTEQHS